MLAGQSLTASIGDVIKRNKYDVVVEYKGGDKRAFSDAVIHHMDGWIVVCEFNGDDWCNTTTHGIRGEDVRSYTVRAWRV